MTAAMTADEAQRLLDGREAKGRWRSGSVEREGKVWAHDPDALGGHGVGEVCIFNANMHAPHNGNRALCAAAPRLAASVVALHAQLAQVTAERDALRARAELAEAERADALSELTRVTQERDAALEEKARESVAAVEVSSAHRRLVAQVEHLGAIVEGRTTPPSDEELAAHDGPWLVVLDHSAGHAARVVRGLDAQQHADRQRELRRAWVWHPVDERDGAIVAWPVVTR